MEKKTLDCLFATIPFTDTSKPLMAPAIMKSIATKAGKTAKTVDLNLDFLEYLKNVTDQNRKLKIIGFFREETWCDSVAKDIEKILHNMATKIINMGPKLVGLSVFTYNCRCAAKYLSWLIKKSHPEITIIIGGAGIKHHLAGPAKFARDLKKTQLIDHYIYGDGEHVLFNYLTTGKIDYMGLDSEDWHQLSNDEIRSLPIPNYDDYDFLHYELPRSLPILGSRGCVRHCDFCDIHAHWKKFSYRDAENIFLEMLHLSKKFQVYHFHFTDSLINGNMKEYRVLMTKIADHNKNKPDSEKLRWSSFFILRSKSSFSEDDWRLTMDGGALQLAVGIETLSDAARKKLGKNFTNEDIEYAFTMAQKYPGFKFVLLFLTGYPTETDEDHEFELQWWPQQVKYKDVISAVNTGTPLGILHNSPLHANFEKMGLVSVGPAPEDWVNPATDNTPQKRVRWNQEIVDVVTGCGFNISRGHDAHYILERMRSRDG